MADQYPDGRPALGDVMWRGLRNVCPACGEGKLYVSYLKQAERCPHCHVALGHLRSDDAAPWLTILVVGHVTVPAMLLVEQHTHWPTWVAMTVWPLFAIGLTLAVLPRVKGFLLSVIWALKAPGSEPE
ncbi:MAG: DUF983 domain-containing protein [Kiloniellaceae bacterium]